MDELEQAKREVELLRKLFNANENAVREELAGYAHEAWSGWMKYLFSKCTLEESGVVIPAWAVTRWQRQMNTPYSELPEGEKQSDRKEADRMLRIING